MKKLPKNKVKTIRINDLLEIELKNMGYTIQSFFDKALMRAFDIKIKTCIKRRKNG